MDNFVIKKAEIKDSEQPQLTRHTSFMDIEKVAEKKRITDAIKFDQDSEESTENFEMKNRKGLNLSNNLEFLSVPKNEKK